MSRNGIFLKVLISTFCELSDGFPRSCKGFSSYTIIPFYLLLWNYLLILEFPTETLLRIPFSVIGRCSLVPTSYRLQGKCARINLSQAAFGLSQTLTPFKISLYPQSRVFISTLLVHAPSHFARFFSDPLIFPYCHIFLLLKSTCLVAFLNPSSSLFLAAVLPGLLCFVLFPSPFHLLLHPSA